MTFHHFHRECPLIQFCLHTHLIALRALERENEAGDHFQRAYERVMLVADRFTGDSLRQSWPQREAPVDAVEDFCYKCS